MSHRTHIHHSARYHARRRGGFTLLELMISIALVLMLVLGVNEVFSLSSRTVGAGQALSTINRDARAAQGTIYEDFTNAVIEDGPFLIINSQREWGWRSLQDQLADRDANFRTIDLDRDNTEGNSAGENISTTVYNSRNHRTDRIGFFARGIYRRQTGNDGTFAADMTSNEAYIWYGHLKKPDNSYQLTNYWNPGSGDQTTNPYNYYATDWVLGRVCMLVRETENGQIMNRDGTQQQVFIRRSGTVNTANLSPLAENSSASDSNRIQWSRYDLAQTSIDGFRAVLDKNTVPGPNNNPAASVTRWWDRLSIFRFQGNPVPPKPLTSVGVSQVAPCFLSGCTQFMVEYAGDFLTQDANGNVLSDPNPAVTDPVLKKYKQDGVTDFVYDAATNSRSVRWYGFPRDTNNDGVINAQNDVVPIRDIAGVIAPFEHLSGSENYSGPPNDGIPFPAAGNYASVPDSAAYVCAWGSDTRALGIPTPTMLRITITLDDKGNRIGAGQTFEYVVKVR